LTGNSAEEGRNLPPTTLRRVLDGYGGRYVTAGRLAQIGHTLSEADWRVLEFVARSDYATTRQIERACFTEGSAPARARAARRLVQRLTEEQLLYRLDRPVGGHGGGSGASVVTLERGGARLVAQRHELPSRRFRSPEERGLSFLSHSLCVTEHQVALIEHLRLLGNAEVLRWVGEPDCHRRFRLRGRDVWLRPDALVEARVAAEAVTSFLEVDRSTQSLPTLERKLLPYLRYARLEPKMTPQVVVSLISRRRLEALSELLPGLASRAGVSVSAASRLIRLGSPEEAVQALSGTEAGR
jgi:hypothetical protein